MTATAKYVFLISVDGLRSRDVTGTDLQSVIEAGNAPTFQRLQNEAAWTHNARPDTVHTNTLPNHSSMITGRPVEDVVPGQVNGHRYRFNSDGEDLPTGQVPAPGVNVSTLHTSAGEYVPGVFNVAHDAGASTALYASKSKFSLYNDSYDGAGDYETSGLAVDKTGVNNGLDKLDTYVNDSDIASLTTKLLADIAAGGPAALTFLHLRSPDSAGHGNNWGSTEYRQAIADADTQIGRLIAAIEANPLTKGQTAIIVTSDHGGGGDEPVTEAQHGNPEAPDNFTIPFYVWGPTVTKGADLYSLNPASRQSPAADDNPDYLLQFTGQEAAPIRNSDSGNLALDLLGFDAVPTSFVNGEQTLDITRGQQAASADPRPFSVASAEILDDITLLNRAVYGGDDDMQPEFRQDYRPVRDPNDVGNRSALNVYDRYDLYLEQFGFKTLSAAELGFTAAQRSASETTDGLDKNFTYAGDLYRNNYQKLSDGTLVPFTDAGAVAIAAVKESAAGKTLHLVFRGTDADLGKDGEAGTGQGQVRYYQQLKPLIDQALNYVKNAANGIDEVVVSGHSLGGAMADMFAIYDGAKFAAVQGLKLKVVALASAGIDPATLGIKTDYNRNIVTQDAEGISFRTPSWYSQYDHSEDIVRNPERYNTARHAEEDPQQAPVTRAAVSTLLEHIHFEEGRLQIEAPLIDQYEISKNFSTNFLSEHYASFYERVGEGVAAAAPYARSLNYDRFITLHGENDTLAGTTGNNNVNGWNVPIDNTRSYARSTADIFIMGLSGEDRITTGSGADLLSGGFGDDILFGGAGADILVGLDENDLLYGQSGADRLHGGQGIDRLYGYTGADRLSGQDDNDRLFGGANNDFLSGDDGNDRLAGGLGADRLLGGSGRDGFVFNTAPASGNADAIVRFSHADDTIFLAESVFAALGETVTTGELKIAATAEAARATQDNDHLIYNTSTGQLYYDADGVGGAFKTIVATLTNSPNNLAFDDFVMV